MKEVVIGVGTAICTAIIACLSRLTIKKYKSHSSDHQLLKEANLHQIKAQLLFMYRHSLENGSVTTIEELQVFEDMYGTYKKLGGNGFMYDITNKMRAMKIVTD